MRPENGVWVFTLNRASGKTVGMGWFEDGRIRWATDTGDPQARVLDTLLELRLGEWVSDREEVQVLPPTWETFRLSNPLHAAPFFESFRGETLSPGFRAHVSQVPEAGVASPVVVAVGGGADH